MGRVPAKEEACSEGRAVFSEQGELSCAKHEASTEPEKARPERWDVSSVVRELSCAKHEASTEREKACPERCEPVLREAGLRRVRCSLHMTVCFAAREEAPSGGVSVSCAT
jgi:hypothetical protein